MKTKLFALLLCFAIPSEVWAFAGLDARLPNAVTSETSDGTTTPCITCHTHPGGGRGCLAVGEEAPCINPFGMDFGTQRFSWSPALAEMDSDGDGFSNGQELQNPAGDWTIGQPAPGVPLQATPPGSADRTPGDVDSDGDGFCFFGQDLNADGDCLDDGENNGELDCDDTRDSVHSQESERCEEPADIDCNGLPTLLDPVCVNVVDNDLDGYCEEGRDRNGDEDCVDTGEDTGDVDCDDAARTVFPGARENCVDGLDNNCDDASDRDDPSCNGEADMDGDGFCPIGTDLNDDGDCLDENEDLAGYDCDDTMLSIGIEQMEICGDELDTNCDGQLDRFDPACERVFDADGDGYCEDGRDGNGDGDCVDEGESDEPGDCNDDAPDVNPGAAEVCTTDVDDDCDGAVALDDDDCVGFLDRDGDGFCPVGVDRDEDGNCAGRGEVAPIGDCDDENDLASPAFEELCLNGFDDNCDGQSDGRDAVCEEEFFDFDGDGYCRGGIDLDASGTCDGTGEQQDEGDLDEMDPSIYPGAPENCFDGKDNDQNGDVDLDDASCTRDSDGDGDGYCPVGRDLNGDGDCLDEGEDEALTDCDDSDATISPGAAEMCRAPADADCDGLRGVDDPDCDIVLDQDGDGFCPDGVDDNRDGDCLDSGEDRFGEDCDDTSPAIGPRARETCDDGIDNDCDGDVDLDDIQCPCQTDAHCDDGDPCTDDVCGARGCEHTPACMDAGMVDAGADAAPMDAAPGDAGMDSGGGCNAGAQSTWLSLLILLGLGMMALRRRD